MSADDAGVGAGGAGGSIDDGPRDAGSERIAPIDLDGAVGRANDSAVGADAGTNEQSGDASGGQGADAAAGDGGAGDSGRALWKPTAGTSWQWQLTGTIDTTLDVSVYDIDGFDSDASLVKTLHDKHRKVICYLSVGSYEDWRPDAKSFPTAVLGNDYPGWPGERFVDIRAKALRDVMAARLDLCKQKGFDGVEPDNMDVYSANSGFPLTESDGIAYALWLAGEAHARGLNIGQKNAPEIVRQIHASFDWALTEDCYNQGWCTDVSVYVNDGKPVFMSEYTDTFVNFAAVCTWAKPNRYSPILKGRDLDAPVQFCP